MFRKQGSGNKVQETRFRKTGFSPNAGNGVTGCSKQKRRQVAATKKSSKITKALATRGQPARCEGPDRIRSERRRVAETAPWVFRTEERGHTSTSARDRCRHSKDSQRISRTANSRGHGSSPASTGGDDSVSSRKRQRGAVWFDLDPVRTPRMQPVNRSEESGNRRQHDKRNVRFLDPTRNQSGSVRG